MYFYYYWDRPEIILYLEPEGVLDDLRLMFTNPWSSPTGNIIIETYFCEQYGIYKGKPRDVHQNTAEPHSHQLDPIYQKYGGIGRRSFNNGAYQQCRGV